MDKYIIKTPKNSPIPTTSVVRTTKKQATLESLKGVVVIEDILRHKATLEWTNQSEDMLLKSLLELKKKHPSKEILLSTKIDHLVRKLRRHSNSEISAQAKDVYSCWKSHILSKANRPKIEVRSDLQTEKLRATARKWLAAAISEEEDSKLVNVLEAEVFHSCNRLVKDSYRRTVRKITFALKHNESKRETLKLGKMSVQELVKECKR